MPSLIRKRATEEVSELERYRKLIQLDRNALDSAAEEQAQLFLDVCDHHSMAISMRDQAKENLGLVDAELASKIRRSTETKMTEGAISEQVVQSAKHVEAATAYERKSLEAALWGNLRSAFDQRAKMIRELTTQYSAGYFTVQSSVHARRHGPAVDEGRTALLKARK